METLGNENALKTSNYKFRCELCDYNTCRKCNYDDHLMSAKHLRKQQGNKNQQKINPEDITHNNCNDLSCNSCCETGKIIACQIPSLIFSTPTYECNICGNKYNNRSGLWKHKKKCINNDEYEMKEFMKYLIKENSDLKSLMIEAIKKDNNNTNNITTSNSHNNSHNKTFNLQFFLNETCKDAMNIMDFVDSIQLKLSDLEDVGKLGYVNGISKILINNLNALEETKRPIHCTDSKREILYVKDENIWKKDNENNKICIKKAIKRVAFKNCKLIPEFREKHPDCSKHDSRYADQYNKMIVEAMGGTGDNDMEKEEKIIRNISKHVQIEKNEYN
jgi:hypothetical protein